MFNVTLGTFYLQSVIAIGIVAQYNKYGICKFRLIS